MVGSTQAQRPKAKHPKMDTHDTVQHNRIAWKTPTCVNGVFQDDNQAMSHTERTQSTWCKTGRSEGARES